MKVSRATGDGRGPLRAVVFDCDGVLFDSARANVAYYDAVLAALGRPPLDAAATRLAHSLSSTQLFTALFGDDPALTERARAQARATAYTPFYRWMQPVPALYDLLGGLRSKYRLAMATNRGVTVSGVVRHFGLAAYLDLAVGVDDSVRPKPFPDMLDKCIRHFGIAPHQAVYVGDSAADYAAATAAGVHFIGIGDATGAALRLRSVAELPACLEIQWPHR